MLRKISRAYQIVRHYGPEFCIFRAQYILRKKSGLLKCKFPVRPWSEIALSSLLGVKFRHQADSFLQTHQSNGRRFIFERDDLAGLNKLYKEEVVSQANNILQNKFLYFFNKSEDLGPEPDWFLNPSTGQRIPPDKHWCDIDFFSPEVGDIKFIWEPSRFAWAYTLVRAYAATQEDRYAEKFWSLFESWLKANQPNMGPNYVCGQECAIRLMAMCFAFYGLADAKASTIERRIKLVTAIAVHAERIEKNITFSIFTRTNHALSESAGIYTAGTLFPEFKHSGHWVKLGKKIFTSEGLKQIYPDGSYIQHSMNYHRLMLQDFLWVMRLGQLNGDSFCKELASRVRKAVDFLYQMQDGENGQTPNYGNNDGALIIPLNSCDYLDYRPVLQAANYLFNKTRLYEPGAWDEDLLWFFGSKALESPLKLVRHTSKAYKHGGYYTIRDKDSWAMMRCHSYKNRPAHADMLHLDLWWKGQNILRDSGTFSYSCCKSWQSYFGSTAAHNTIIVDGADQMQKASRFMWFGWTKSRFIARKSEELDSIQIIKGEHYGYRTKKGKVTHRRCVLSFEDPYWLIVDDLLGLGTHKVELYWQLGEYDYELISNKLIMQTDRGPVCIAILDSADKGKCKCFKGRDDAPAGWQSLYYGSRQAAPVLICSETTELPIRFVTIVSLGDTIEKISISGTNTVTWISKISRQKHVFALDLADTKNI